MVKYSYSTDSSYGIIAEVFTGTTDEGVMYSTVEIIFPFPDDEGKAALKDVYNWEAPTRPEWTSLYTELYALYCGAIVASGLDAQKLQVKVDSSNLIQFFNSYYGEEERIPEQDTRALMADLYSICQSMSEFNIELRPEYH